MYFEGKNADMLFTYPLIKEKIHDIFYVTLPKKGFGFVFLETVP